MNLWLELDNWPIGDFSLKTQSLSDVSHHAGYYITGRKNLEFENGFGKFS
jgi:hypothetical protein